MTELDEGGIPAPEATDATHAAGQAEDVVARVEDRAGTRARNVEIIARRENLAEADSPERVATRLDRLSYHLLGERPPAHARAADVSGDADAVIGAAFARAAEPLREAGLTPPHDASPAEAAGLVLEALIGTTDFIGVRYLPAGARAAQAVARVAVFSSPGVQKGWGSGSMVSPRLFLTNHHVLPDPSTAAISEIEFNYQVGLDGKLMTPVRFPLDPRALFITDAALDFTLVAVADAGGGLAAFGFNPLIGAEGKAIVGDFVSIVQHPQAQPKQVALRENRVVDVFDDFLHYVADTEPGSSGSPVFNDQWEVVALHHASVRDPQHAELGGIVNEGIRISRILPAARRQSLDRDAVALLSQLEAATGAGSVTEAVAPGGGSGAAGPAIEATADGGALRVRIPIDVTIAVGTAAPAAAPGPTPAAAPPPSITRATATTGAADAVVAGQEGVSIDPNYGNRRGFDPAFLGRGHRVALPTLPEDLLARAARPAGARGAQAHVLPYHHFAVVLDTARRLAFFTAVNVDGSTVHRGKRADDRWFYDPRIPRDVQTGEDAYTHPDLDRGHLVRRLDPSWGATEAASKVAADDTFHFTNCTPQHKDFNRAQARWAGLEDYLLEHAETLGFKAIVFTGPVLADSDDAFGGVQLPRQFWKVAVMLRRRDRSRSATAYLLSQEDLLAKSGLEELEAAPPEEFDYGAYRTFQVPVARVEALTRLDFGDLRADDPLAGGEEELVLRPRAVSGPGDLVL